MKKFDLVRVAPLALSVALSLALSLTAVNTIAALGMKSIAAAEEVPQHDARPLLAQANRTRVAGAARAY
jgi:hypothetical protein